MLALNALAANLAEAGGDHHEAGNARLPAFACHLQHVLLGNNDDGEVYRVRQLGDGGVGTDGVHHIGPGIHRIYGPRIAISEQAVQDDMADGVGPTAGADHRDGSRFENGSQALELSSVHGHKDTACRGASKTATVRVCQGRLAGRGFQPRQGLT